MADSVGTKGMPRSVRETLILDAATRRFAQHGYAGTSLAHVAQAAGITKPLVYSYFGRKDDLFVACLARASDNLVTEVTTRVADPRANVDTAYEVIAATLAALEPCPYAWSLLYDVPVPTDTRLAEALHEHRSRVAAVAIDGVRHGAHAAGITDEADIGFATEVWMSTLSAIVRWWVQHPEYTAADTVDRCRRLLGTILSARAEG